MRKQLCNVWLHWFCSTLRPACTILGLMCMWFVINHVFMLLLSWMWFGYKNSYSTFFVNFFFRKPIKVWKKMCDGQLQLWLWMRTLISTSWLLHFHKWLATCQLTKIYLNAQLSEQHSGLHVCFPTAKVEDMNLSWDLFTVWSLHVLPVLVLLLFPTYILKTAILG